MNDDINIEKETTLQLIRQSIRSRSLSRLKQAFERPWSVKVIVKFGDSKHPTAYYRMFKAALKEMKKEERQRAFQWTWDCYHPFMSDLGKCLEDMDGYVKQQQL